MSDTFTALTEWTQEAFVNLDRIVAHGKLETLLVRPSSVTAIIDSPLGCRVQIGAADHLVDGTAHQVASLLGASVVSSAEQDTANRSGGPS